MVGKLGREVTESGRVGIFGWVVGVAAGGVGVSAEVAGAVAVLAAAMADVEAVGTDGCVDAGVAVAGV